MHGTHDPLELGSDLIMFGELAQEGVIGTVVVTFVIGEAIDETELFDNWVRPSYILNELLATILSKGEEQACCLRPLGRELSQISRHEARFSHLLRL